MKLLTETQASCAKEIKANRKVVSELSTVRCSCHLRREERSLHYSVRLDITFLRTCNIAGTSAHLQVKTQLTGKNKPLVVLPRLY